MKAWQLLAELVARLLGRERKSYAVPDIRDMREEEIRREVRIERALAELEELQRESARRLAESDKTIK